MHSPPAVSFPVRPSRDANRLLFMLWGLGAACAGGAMLQLDARAALLASSVLCAGMGCWYFTRRVAPGVLTFDGQHWWLSGQPRTLPAGRAQIALDLQFLMLLRLKAPYARAQWLWVERRADPTRWADLRRAVYSRAPTTAAAETPADAAALGGPSSFR